MAHGVGYQFQRAVKTLQTLTPDQRQQVRDLCLDISEAQKALRRKAAPLYTRCHTICKGLCCRNVTVEALVHHGDFVLLLTLAEHLKAQAAACLKNENPLYPADCIFLADGVGPCIFPDNVRPQICITAFCSDTAPARAEIRRLKVKFFKLDWQLALWTFSNRLRRVRLFLNSGS
ncbi:MAG: hypothetical protein WBG37_12705 [Desulfobacterales bacterium]